MKSIVIYKSNTGYTKEYSLMLSESLNCEVIPLDRIRTLNLSDYDTIIFGGGVRASKITGIKSLIKRLPQDASQNIIIFAVGANGLSDHNTQELRAKNLVENNIDYPLFYMQGGFDPEKLNFALKIMLQGLAKSMKKKADKDPESLSQEDKDFLAFFQDKHDEVSKDNTLPLISFVEGLK